MSVVWLAPVGLFGVVFVALPIAVHLLARHQARQVPFPSLRFLQQTQLAALRRRNLEDVLLLVCRVLTIALAALALAGPIVHSATRSAAYAARLSRAVILTGPAPDDRARQLQADAFQSAAFHRAELSDAVSDALLWLDAQPASAREVVFAGALHRGDVTEADVRRIPPDVGIRFAASGATASTDVTIPILTRRNGALVLVSRSTHLSAEATRVTTGGVQPLPADAVSILAANQIVADAALNAALDAGVPWRQTMPPVVLAWEDADAAAVARSRTAGARIVMMAVPQPVATSADAVYRELRQLSPPDLIEPVVIPDAQLQRWSRPPGPPSAAAPLVDEGDRRWLWLGALVLLALEWRLRRSRIAARAAAATTGSEARVA